MDNTGEQQDDEQSQNLTESKIEEKLGYVFTVDKDSKSFEFELVEWITTDDANRINELGLTAAFGRFGNTPLLPSSRLFYADLARKITLR